MVAEHRQLLARGVRAEENTALCRERLATAYQEIAEVSALLPGEGSTVVIGPADGDATSRRRQCREMDTRHPWGGECGGRRSRVSISRNSERAGVRTRDSFSGAALALCELVQRVLDAPVDLDALAREARALTIRPLARKPHPFELADVRS